MYGNPDLEETQEAREYVLAGRIRIVRESKGYTQEYVANRLNISQQAYSNIEKNQENVTLKRLRELSSVLGVGLGSLVGDEDSLVQQNFQQQGGNAGTILHVSGLGDAERNLYERYIADLKSEIESLRKLLKTNAER
jgi:transcriptional regulator with XRE-family HTH domain